MHLIYILVVYVQASDVRKMIKWFGLGLFCFPVSASEP